MRMGLALLRSRRTHGTDRATYPSGVLRHGIYLQEKKLLEEGVDRRNYSIKQQSMDVTMEVVSCWQRANAQFRPPVQTGP